MSIKFLYARQPNSTKASLKGGGMGVLTLEGQAHTLCEMESLHAPWRIEYILAPKEPGSEASLFTRIAQSNDDEANYVIARDRTCFALLNRYPYTGGHLMVVPYKAAVDFNDLTDEEMTDLMRLMRRCQNALSQAMNAQGFNIGINLGKAAGAGIAEHLHIHVVPRWAGDTNFMPVIAQTTVVPQALSELAGKLRAILAKDGRHAKAWTPNSGR